MFTVAVCMFCLVNMILTLNFTDQMEKKQTTVLVRMLWLISTWWSCMEKRRVECIDLQSRATKPTVSKSMGECCKKDSTRQKYV